MPPGSARIARLEALIGSGMPLHLPLAQWPPATIERVANDPSLLGDLTLEDLDALGAQVRAAIIREGGDPDASPPVEPLSTSSRLGETNAHGRLPFALTCGCGVCSVWRDRHAGSTVAT